MQRPRIPADEQPAPLHERPELGQIELPEIDDPIGRRPERLPRGRRNALRSLAVRRPGAEDDPAHRRCRRKTRNQRGERRFRPSPERVARADVRNHQLVCPGDSRGPEAPLDPRHGARIRRHLHAVARRVRSARGPAFNRLEQVPLIDDRVPRPERPRTSHRFRVHPRAPGDRVPDSCPCPGRERQPRAPRPSVQIDDEIVARSPQLPREPHIGADSGQAARPGRDDHLIEVRVPTDNGRRRRLDEIREMRVWKRPLQRPRNRRRKDDVSN